MTWIGQKTSVCAGSLSTCVSVPGRYCIFTTVTAKVRIPLGAEFSIDSKGILIFSSEWLYPI